MNALVMGYGSDSSSEVSDKAVKEGKTTGSEGSATAGATATGTAVNNSTLGRLVNYGEDDSSGDEYENGPKAMANATTSQSSSTSKSGIPLIKQREPEPSNNEEIDTTPLAKRPKLSNVDKDRDKRKEIENEEVTDTVTCIPGAGGLPQPRLFQPSCADDPYTSLALFSKNYIQEKISQQSGSLNQPQNLSSPSSSLSPSTTRTQQLSDATWDTLNQLRQNTASFAKTLKSQKEFGNPHLFPSVIEYFEIDPMESNISLDVHVDIDANNSTNKDGKADIMGVDSKRPSVKIVKSNDKFEKFEYLERLMQKEEENRIRNLSSL